VYDLIRKFSAPADTGGALFGGRPRGDQIPERVAATLTLKYADIALFPPNLLIEPPGFHS
jgi:hypothetical protein